MTTRTTVEVLCDPCHRQGRDNPGRSVDLTIDGTHRSVDLCSSCAAPVDAVRELVREYGRAPRNAEDAAPPSRLVCGECGKSLSPRSRYVHAKGHGVTANDITWTRVTG